MGFVTPTLNAVAFVFDLLSIITETTTTRKKSKTNDRAVPKMIHGERLMAMIAVPVNI